MKTAFAALLTTIILSLSAAYGAEAAKGDKRLAPRQAQKMSKPAELIVGTRKYIAEKASKTAEIIKINAAKIKQTVWPQPRWQPQAPVEPQPAAKAVKQDQKAARKETRDQRAKTN